MKRMKYLSMKIAIIGLALMPFVSCNKIDPDWNGWDPDGKFPLLKIKKTIFYAPGDTTVHTFHYNKLGDPSSITVSRPQGPKRFQYFRYNNKRQLTDYIIADSAAQTFLRWNHYVWDNERIVRDTVRFNGSFVNNSPDPGLPGSLFMFNTFYQYDTLNRISEYYEVPITPPTSGWQARRGLYTYNSQKNLSRLVLFMGFYRYEYNYTGYDDKLNLRMLHPVWMFLAKNASVNNQRQAIAYNRFGFPRGFRPLTAEEPFFLLEGMVDLNNTDIQYE